MTLENHVSQDHQRQAKANPSSVSAQDTYYDCLGVNPASSVQEIRQAYRELSKLYHPDTTQLSLSEAKQKFQRLNEAYATLSNPEQRLQYDLKAGFSRFSVVQPPANFQTPKAAPRQPTYTSSAYLDPNDRPLSPGEIFALVILGITFLLCLILAVVLSFSHSQAKFDLLRSANGATTTAIVADLKSNPSSAHPEPFRVPAMVSDQVAVNQAAIVEVSPENESDAEAPTSFLLPAKIPWFSSVVSPSPESAVLSITNAKTIISDEVSDGSHSAVDSVAADESQSP